MICAVCGRDVVWTDLWPGVNGDRPICYEGGEDCTERLMGALGITREGGWLASGPWGPEPPPEGIMEWMRTSMEFRELLDATIEMLRELPCAGSNGSGKGS